MIKRATAIRIGAALSMSGALRLPASADGPIRMQTSAVDSAAEPFYAYDAGFFKAAGLDVELGPASANGAAISSAVAGGAVDVGMSNLVSIALAHARNIPFVAIGPGGLYTAKTPSTLLIVPQGSSQSRPYRRRRVRGTLRGRGAQRRHRDRRAVRRDRVVVSHHRALCHARLGGEK